MFKYKIGDLVIIKHLKDYLDGPGVDPDMEEFINCLCAVTEHRGAYENSVRYKLKSSSHRGVSCFIWDERWLERVSNGILTPEEEERILKLNKNVD